MKIRRIIYAEDVKIDKNRDNKFYFTGHKNVDSAVFYLFKHEQKYYWLRDDDQNCENVLRLKPKETRCQHNTGIGRGKYIIHFSEEDLNV